MTFILSHPLFYCLSVRSTSAFRSSFFVRYYSLCPESLVCLICADALRLQSCSVSSAAVQHNLQSTPPCRCRSSASGSKTSRTALYFRRPTPQRRMKNTFVRSLSWTCNPVPATLAAAIVPRRREKVRSARQFFDSYRSMIHSVGRRWDIWPDIKILVSGPPPEIVPTRLSMADFAIRRGHKSESEERHVRRVNLRIP